jgi:hypothetical protein
MRRAVGGEFRADLFYRLDIFEAELARREKSRIHFYPAVYHRPDHVVNGLASIIDPNMSLVWIVYCYFKPILIEVHRSQNTRERMRIARKLTHKPQQMELNLWTRRSGR